MLLTSPHVSVSGRAPCSVWMHRYIHHPDLHHLLVHVQDIWALGVIGFEALVGGPALPWLRSTADAVMLADGSEPYPWERSHVAPEFVQSRAYPVIVACLHRDPARRPTAPAILQAIDELGSTAAPSLLRH
jgi:serine/threonine protein kinase